MPSSRGKHRRCRDTLDSDSDDDDSDFAPGGIVSDEKEDDDDLSARSENNNRAHPPRTSLPTRNPQPFLTLTHTSNSLPLAPGTSLPATCSEPAPLAAADGATSTPVVA